MKKLFFIFLMSLPSFAFSQQLPVQLIVHTSPIGLHRYLIQFDILIEKGWNLFAQADTASGIDPLILSLEDENIPILNDLMHEAGFKTVLIHDALTGNKSCLVYTKEIIAEKTIETGEDIRPLCVTLKGDVSNGEKILPIEIIKKVSLESNDLK